MAFRKNEGFGGGNRSGGFRPGGGRPPFRGGGFGGSRDRDERPKQMHPATCADCGIQTEVPFRPDGSRPIYCKNCFPKHDTGRPVPPPRRDFGGSRETPRFERREEAPRPAAPDRRIDDLLRDVSTLSKKLDALVSQIAQLSAPKVASVAAAEREQAAAPKKPAAKKAAPKASKPAKAPAKKTAAKKK